MDISELKRIGLTEKIKRHPWELARTRIAQKLLQQANAKLEYVIDVGSGDAFFLKSLARKNNAKKYIAVDTEYTTEITEQIFDTKDTAKVSFYNSVTQLQKVVSIKADTVLLMDVIEHCENDKHFLESISQLEACTENTIFLITVPAFQSLFSSHDKLLSHFRRYNRKQLITLCNGAGLKILKSNYFFTLPLFISAMRVLLEKLKLHKSTKSLDGWKGNSTITRLFYAILWMDFQITDFLLKIGVRIPGLSCYCICQKSQL